MPEKGTFWYDFLTSAGFGGTAAVVAAVLALVGVWVRITYEKDQAARTRTADEYAAKDADARQRWWDTLTWVWANRDFLAVPELFSLLKALKPLARTVTQIAFLELVTAALFHAPAPPAAAEGTQ